MKFLSHYIILFGLVGLFWSQRSLAQNTIVDSLETLLEKTPEKDFLKRVMLYNDLCWEYQHDDLETSLSYGKKALKIAQNNQLYDEFIVAKRYMGLAYVIWGESDTAIALYKDALSKGEQLKMCSDQLALIHSDISSAYKKRGDHITALDFYHKGIKMADSCSTDRVRMSLRVNLAMMFFGLEESEKCIQISREIINITDSELNYIDGVALQLIGTSYSKMDCKDSARAYCLKALDIFKASQQIEREGGCYNSLGIIEHDLGNFEAALSYYKKSLEIRKAIDDREAIHISYSNVGAIYYEMNKIDSANYYLTKSIELAIQNNYQKDLIATYKGLSEVQYIRGEFKEAYDNLETHLRLKDSLPTEESRMEILKRQYEFEDEERSINEALLRNEYQKTKASLRLTYALIAGGLGLLILLSIVIYMIYKNRQIKHEKIRIELEKSVLDLKSTALMAQLNPHLVFNILNSIQGLVASNEREKANIYIAKFSKFMRKCIELAEIPSIPLEEELSLMKEYFDLEKLRFGESISLKIINPSSSQINTPPLILQPLIENSIKHGIQPNTQQKGEVLIEVIDNALDVQILVKDNGKGFSSQHPIKKGHGMAISLTRLSTLNKGNRLELIQEKNPSIVQLTLVK